MKPGKIKGLFSVLIPAVSYTPSHQSKRNRFISGRGRRVDVLWRARTLSLYTRIDMSFAEKSDVKKDEHPLDKEAK